MLPPKARENVHGAALVLLGAFVPLGEGVALGALGLVAVSLAARWRDVRPRVLIEGTAGTVHAGLVVWAAAGVFALMVTSQGWHKPSELALWSPFLAIPLIVLSAPMLEPKWLDRAAMAFVIVLGIGSAYGILQYLLDARPGEALFRYNKSRTTQIAVPGGDGTVAGGFFFHRLKMAHVLLPGIGILVARQLFHGLVWRRRLVEAALLLLFGATLLLTFTRGALLAAVVALAACLLFASNRTRWTTVAVVVLLCGVGLSVPTVRQRVVSIASSEALQTRGFIWASGAQIIADHPHGTGLGNYPEVVPNYYDLVDPHFGVLTYPHNVALAALAETGPVGLVGLMWAWAAVAAACLRMLWRRDNSARRGAVAAAGLFAVVAFWFLGLTHDVLFHKPVNLAFCGLVGWVLATLDARGDTP